MARHLTDEEIISALINCGSVKAAAGVLGCQEKTIYARKKAEAFQEIYRTAQAEAMQDIAIKVRREMLRAIDTICDIMNDSDVSEKSRLYAASIVLNKGIRIIEYSDFESRLTELEKQLEQREKCER